MSVKLRNITRHTLASFAGIRNDIKIIVPADVQSYTDDEAEGGITVKPGATIYQVGANPRSVRIRESRTGGVHGHAFRRSLSMAFRKMEQEKQGLREELTNRRVHLLFSDENCLTYVYLNMKLVEDEAENGPGGNEIRMRFEGGGRKPAPFVQGVLLPGPTGPTVGDGYDDLPDAGNPIITDTGGVDGDGTDVDIGGDPGNGGDPGGDPDPPLSVPNRAIARQPSTGELREIIIGECEEMIVIPYVE